MILFMNALVSFSQIPTHIEWDLTTRKFITVGVYSRAKKISTGDLLLVYSDGPNALLRRSSDNGNTWGATIIVAQNNGYNNTNSEIIQLQNGWLLYTWNGRPQTEGVLPYTIHTKISRDNGYTWGDERTLYNADVYFYNGCWEPSMIQIPSGEIQLFFANENPYRSNSDQEISLTRSFDNGLTWSTAQTASHRAGYRDGMPVPLYLKNNQGIVYSIEDNGLNGNFKPSIISSSTADNWNQGVVDATSARRWGALVGSSQLDAGVYAGGPYVIQMPSGETILSCQSSEGRASGDDAIMKVYMGDANAKNFANETSPFSNVPAGGNALWNSLTVLDDNTIMATSSINGVAQSGIWMVIGKVVRPAQTPFSGNPLSLPGRIEAENFDKGGEAVAYHDNDASNLGTAYRTSEAVDIEACAEGGYDVGWTNPGEFLEYTVNVSAAGKYNFKARVASVTAGKSFHIELNGANISGTIAVPNTGDWQTWQTVTTPAVNLNAGIQVLKIYMDTDGFNLNYVDVSSAINQAPSVSISSPLNNASFVTPATITINANANDADGTISKVDFYNGTTLLGSDNSAPYSYSWTNVNSGNYTITAKASDNQNAVTTSAAIVFTVTVPTPTGQWTQAQANQWYKNQPWIVGCNFIPSTAENQLEMWQAETFDPATIDRELGYAESIGMNTVRVFLHYLVWQQNWSGYRDRISSYLQIADRHKIKTIFVLFDDCWNGSPHLGIQPAPIPGVHNSQWVESPGDPQYKDPSLLPSLAQYTNDVLSYYKNDSRVLLWDLYNEAGNGNHGQASFPLLKQAFATAWQVRPSQPISSCWWTDEGDMDDWELQNSDVITFHCYNTQQGTKSLVESNMKQYNRPIICTEYMARTIGSTFQTVLPYLYEQNIGAINWGLVDGKTQTKFPWGSPAGGPEPALWFHEIFHKDGTPYKVTETDMIRVYATLPKNFTTTNILPTSENQPQAWSYTFNNPASGWNSPGFNSSSWNTGNAGFGNATLTINPATVWNSTDIWLTKKFTMIDFSQEMLNSLLLRIYHDEDAEIYFNGVLAAKLSDFSDGYIYFPINRAALLALKPGQENTIAVHCHQTVGGQFIDLGIISLTETTSSPSLVNTSEITGQTWSYTSTLPSNGWNTLSYNDNNWLSGNGGFGTAGTPNANVNTTWNTSDIWLRKKFNSPQELPSTSSFVYIMTKMWKFI